MDSKKENYYLINFDGKTVSLKGPYDKEERAKEWLNMDSIFILKGEIVWRGPIKLEVGKVYRTCSGRTVNITYLSNFRDFPYLGVLGPVKDFRNSRWIEEETVWYRSDGTPNKGVEEYSIIEEKKNVFDEVKKEEEIDW